MRFVFVLMISMVMLSGCATVLDLSTAVCDAALGGSKAGALCDEIKNLKADEAPVEAPVPVEVPAS